MKDRVDNRVIVRTNNFTDISIILVDVTKLGENIIKPCCYIKVTRR
jgi:hypothetical protein